MESEELLKRAFGLTSYEARAYLALVRARMNAAEVARVSGVPQSRTYDTLRALAQKGFAVESGGVYRAVKPSTALRARLARFSADFGASQAEREDALKRIVEEAEATPAAVQKQRDPEMLRGIDSIGGAFLDVLRSSDDVFLVIRKGMKASAEFLGYVRASEKLDTRIRVLVPQTIELSRGDAAEAKRLGLEVRRSSAALLDMMVGNSEDVIIGVPAHGEDSSFGAVAVWVKDQSFSTSLRSTLEHLWKEAAR